MKASALLSDPGKTMILKSLALTLLLLPPTVSFDASGAPTHLQASTLANVVYVTAGESSGTAFLMRYEGKAYLVTARHVVDAHLDDPTVPLRFLVGGKRGRLIRQVKPFKDSLRADIAVFTYEDEEEDPGVPYFPEGAGLVPYDDVHLAGQVFLVGYPASLKQTYGSSLLRVVGGWIAGLRKFVPGSTVEYIDIDMPGVEHGHSGGPIILLQDRVVAVAVQRRTGSISHTIGATYAVPIKYVTALIDDEPVEEDMTALNETLHGTKLLCGLSLQGKNDYDVWAQRVHRETGESLWGDLGIYVTISTHPETFFLTVPSIDESTLVIHSVDLPAEDDADVMVQRLSKYGELLLEHGVRSLPVCSTPQRERVTDAVSDGAGGAIVAFERYDDSGRVTARVQRVDAGGVSLWDEEGVPLGPLGHERREPRLVSDGSGGVLVVTVSAPSRKEGGHDLRIERIGLDGRPVWPCSVVVAAGLSGEAPPRVVTDEVGGALVLHETDAGEEGRWLRAHRISSDGERPWGDGVIVSALHPKAGSDALALIPDGLGGAFVAAEVLARPGRPADVDIAVQRVAADGTLQWGGIGEDGRPLPLLAASSTWPEGKPVLLADGYGGVIVGFESGSANGDLDLWAQRVDAGGGLMWNGGERSAEVSLSFLSEQTLRIVERQADRVLFVFEVERETGRSAVACQALSLATGKALYGGGKSPVLVLNPGETELSFLLKAR